MLTTPDNAPEVVVENLDKAESRWRMATLGVLALAGFLCVCFSAVLVLNLMQSGALQAGPGSTPTPTDTASPTAPPRPTATGTATETATPTDTATAPATMTFTPYPTLRPLPTNTRPPPPPPPPPVTSTPHTSSTATNTPAPTVAYALRVTQVKTSTTCCSVGVFGTVRNNLNGAIGGIAIRLIRQGSSTAYQVMTTSNFFGSKSDRNFEMSSSNGIGAGSYTLLAVDSSGRALSPSTAVELCAGGGHHCVQWYEVDLQQ